MIWTRPIAFVLFLGAVGLFLANLDAAHSGLPGVNYGHTYGLKVIHISGHNRHAVNKGSGRDESVTIGARTGHVERGAPLGNSSINRKDATVERGQNMAIHPGSKNRALWPGLSPNLHLSDYGRVARYPRTISKHSAT